jgi:transcriptional regulator with XRE-family HTH domain
MVTRVTDRDIGSFIRVVGKRANVSIRQLADQAGVSNPYLSGRERGVRRPSTAVMRQLATALKIATPLMYLRAGLSANDDGAATPLAIATDPELTARQKETLTEMYDSFVRENLRAEGRAAGRPDPLDDVSVFEASQPVQ